jgi:hypothetical protein
VRARERTSLTHLDCIAGAASVRADANARGRALLVRDSDPIRGHTSRRDRAATAHWRAIADDSIVTIVAVITARDTLLAQIPIAQRRS